MPYLPLPPFQPPAIVQALSPEGSSASPSIPSALAESVRSPARASVPTPVTSNTVSLPTSIAPVSPLTSVQSSPNLDHQGQSSREALNTTLLQPAASALPIAGQLDATSSPAAKRPVGTVVPQPASLQLPEPKVSNPASRSKPVPRKFGAASTSESRTPDQSVSLEPSDQKFGSLIPNLTPSAVALSQLWEGSGREPSQRLTSRIEYEQIPIELPSTPNLWELTPSQVELNQVGKGGTKGLLKLPAGSPEYRSVHQALTGVGNALVSSGLVSEMGLEASGPGSSLDTKLSKVHLQSPIKDTAVIPEVDLLKHYGFEPGELTAQQLTDQWRQVYPSNWIRPALIEALYQGRYKAVSVEKILAAWQRRGQPLYHFNQEFERLVYDQLTQKTAEQVKSDNPIAIRPLETSPVPSDTNGNGLQPILSQRQAPTPNNPDAESLELYADRQEYDDVRRIFTAVGNVLLRFRGATLRANQLQVNLQTQLAVAEGNVNLIRGEQRLRGDRLEYNYVQNRGNFRNARGEIYLPTLSSDISTAGPDRERTGFPSDDDQLELDDIDPDGQPLSEQIRADQPRQVRTTEEVQRLRFEAERIEFDARGWQAQEIRITNDPFSPPELEVRADEARLVRVSALEDRGEATRPRVVFDRGLSLPILRSSVVFDRQERDPAIAQVGFDESERGGFFIGRTFEPLLTDQSSLTITPQFFLQRAIEDSNFNPIDPDLYGFNVRLRSALSPLISLTGAVILTSFDPTDIGDNLRANLRLRRPFETPVGTHRLTLEYAFRDRVYNGSEGFEDIQNSLGAVVSSPIISLGDTGIDLNYQIGAQYVTAETEQVGLADPGSLGRFQASASLRRGFYLWQGQALPATATEGLRYTSEPVVPYLQLFTRLTGIASAYTNGDSQETLLGRVGLQGQFGQFSRPFLDYTGFNISYSQIGLLGLSPFLFDRVTDFKVLSAGIVQQIYGPIRVGVQISMSLDTGEIFDSEFLVEYSRRTYGVFLRYNPSREIGSINFQLNGFNWTGGTAPFSGPEPP